jgi:hypothetical protein
MHTFLVYYHAFICQGYLKLHVYLVSIHFSSNFTIISINCGCFDLCRFATWKQQDAQLWEARARFNKLSYSIFQVNVFEDVRF